MEGSATLTMEMSRTTMNWARQTTARSALVELSRRARKFLVASMDTVCDHRYPGTREGIILVVTVPPIAAETPTLSPPELVGATAERRRAELADFLRKRRAVIKPEDVGLPGGGRRRTPGLRREEVSQLAGVGTTWYTWLEQGRDVRASLDVLEAIARALRLTPAERTHLVLLGRGEEPPRCKSEERVSAVVRRLIENLGANPAYVIGRRWDYLAWNAAAVALFGDFAAVPRSARNHLWMHFMDPARRELHPDWDRSARVMAAKFRADSARHIGDPSFEELIVTLRKSSPEFCTAWRKHEVIRTTEGRRVMHHPTAGSLVFEHAVFNPQSDPEQRMILYTPLPDEGTPEKLAQLLCSPAAA
jgi:transcriptional regulator with XRE-family HTH domain